MTTQNVNQQIPDSSEVYSDHQNGSTEATPESNDRQPANSIPDVKTPLLPVWGVIGCTVRGTSHIAEDKENQDAIYCSPQQVADEPILVVVADGHGSARHFRSQTGALFAVQAVQEAWKLFTDSQPLNDLSSCKRLAETHFTRWIVRLWRDKVAEDLITRPISEQEWEHLKTQKPGQERQVALDSALAYGATVLAVLVTQYFLLYVHLGDGDILNVSSAGEVTRPMPDDEQNDGVATTSLCLRDAWNHFRVCFQSHTGELPALIMLSTDGYANSYPHCDEDFYKVSSDYLSMLQSKGAEYVQANIEKWLTTVTTLGSGDDVTLGLLFRLDALTSPATSEPASNPHSN